MMNRILSLILFLMSANTLVYAQNRVNYAYDEAGNRVKREIVIVQGAKASDKISSKSNSFHDMLGERSIKITPNTSGLINVQVLRLLPTDDGIISVCSISGAEIFRQRIVNSENTIDIRNFPHDVYMLSIIVNGIPTTWKITKK